MEAWVIDKQLWRREIKHVWITWVSLTYSKIANVATEESNFIFQLQIILIKKVYHVSVLWEKGTMLSIDNKR